MLLWKLIYRSYKRSYSRNQNTVNNPEIEPLLEKIRELEARFKTIIENTINESKLIKKTFQISNGLNKEIIYSQI